VRVGGEREHQDCDVETGVSAVAAEVPALEVVVSELVVLAEAVTDDAAVVVVVAPSDPVVAIAPHASTKLASAAATTRRRSIEMRRARAARRACTMAFWVSVEVFMAPSSMAPMRGRWMLPENLLGVRYRAATRSV
jgi:hypothetical protein